MESGKYYLMRKDEIITLALLNERGEIEKFSRNISERGQEILPLAYQGNEAKSLYQWWKDRSIPITRDHIENIMKNKGLTPSNYLAQNLGLSLTDYYWVKPINSSLSWKDINLFENDFHENILIDQPKKNNVENKDEIAHYSPNSSLQGNIEKTWTIINGDRYLIKGNHSALSRESLNEVIATVIHEKQGYDNYTKYDLIKIKGKAYKYGCKSKAFTSLDKELISAWDVITSTRKNDQLSTYDLFLSLCEQHGMDKEQLRNDLEYQIMTDFILSGYDRHLNNIAILRDADTLKFLRMAPIYDSGDCLFANRPIPRNEKEWAKMEIASFDKYENKLLKRVTNPNVIDLTKLPPVSFIRKTYEKDENISDSFISKICELYEKKIDMCRNIQLNRNGLVWSK